LEEECRKSGVEVFLEQKITAIQKEGRFAVHTSGNAFSCDSLVIATGGLSMPQAGATGFGYQIARQFGLNIVETSPALDGFLFNRKDLKAFAGLAGVSTDAVVTHGASFRENILFTHAGLSGPAALQASLYWHPGQAIQINFVPGEAGETFAEWFLKYKKKGSKVEVRTLLKQWLPSRLSDRLCDMGLPPVSTLPRLSEKKIQDFCDSLQNFPLAPQSTTGYDKAEVTRGGVNTDELSSKTMEAKKVPGLYFVGEVVDVTGWLGGYNLQWAWSSGWAAGQTV